MEIENTLKKMLVADLFAEIPAERMSVDDSLRDVIGLDSLGFMELRVQAEDTFGVRISDADFTPENFTSIRTVTALVTRLRASAGEPLSSA